ncbi:MAG TPA: App1 family protein [Pyrinomonadaceae bacterium]|nr:App1 family protein [Pyrinomonadaceae bacterium]
MPVYKKKLTFYPSYGYRPEGGGEWRVPVRAWVRNERPMPPDALIRLYVDDEGELTESMMLRLKEALRDFVARDNEGEEVTFRFDGDPAGETFRLRGRTDNDGLIIEEFVLPDETARRLLSALGPGDEPGALRLTAETRGWSGAATSRSTVRLIPPEGLSVVSDVDDTIKVSDITAGKRTVLRRTFLMDFEAAEGMHDRYLRILEHHPAFDNVAFHYVSGSPWQLFRLLHEFLVEKTGFPSGTFHLKSVGFNLEDLPGTFRRLRNYLRGSEYTEEMKLGEISDILARFPRRRFVLIGDSGERDPEVFRALKEREEFRDQIVKIYVRDVSALGEGSDRLRDMVRIDPSGVCTQEPAD